MATLKNACATGGLILATGCFSLSAAAQDGYVDLEAEAAAREAAGRSEPTDSATVPADPYGVQPARSYPATGFGATAAPQPTSPAAPTGSGQPAVGQSGMGNLVLQVQQLQRDVMQLNGKVEEQAHELRTLKEQSLQRYMDLDKRLSSGAQAASTPSAAAVQTRPSPAAADDAQGTGELQAGEKAAYDTAYGLVVGKQFTQAIDAFQQFLRNYPDGRYAANAYYWLGELYLVLETPDLEAARQSFALLISEYPEHAKVPDALYKLGRVQFMKGNSEKAREYLDLVIAQYSSSNSAVAKLAEDFIAENY